MLSIQPFTYTDDDYRIALDINAAVFNEPPDLLEEWKHDDATWNKDYAYYRDFVKRDATVIAYVETFQSPYAYHPRKYECRMFVHPAHDAPDVRPFILDQMLARLRDANLIAIKSGMLDDKPEALRFFKEYGFLNTAEEKLSKLDVTRFDASRFDALLEHVRAGGIVIDTLRAFQQRDPGWERKVYDLEITVNPDIPTTGEKHFLPFEEWRTARLTGPTYDPDAWFVALDSDYLVGHSYGSINRESDPVQFVTGVTAVRREYRRRSIATALKVHVTRYVQTQGVQEIFTSNDAQNPMYQLNLALGFKPLPSWVRVEKPLIDETSDM